ncbi:cyclase [Mycolicibacterium agri]|uniref:Cyclase n=1 Tax=Mycolicibacterium agri TaxID=36811 RepID=A0A2A7N5F7_MYCAG|nr:SRPBCC family protein [Mycolicibacterium agri]PEG38957.1 cyclase [Mycolicibacterium agri]GFG53259.1 hypothetical protein MAGR_47000 [Mycolicibacterium agri]
MTQAVKGAKRQAGRATNQAGKQAQNAAPASPLQASLQQLAGTVTNRAMSSLSNGLGSATTRLTDYAESDGGKGFLSAITGLEDVSSPVKSMVKKGLGDAGSKVKDAAGSLFGGKGKGGGGKKSKVTNIVEHIDMGAPVDLVYRQWTQFADWPKFMKKLEQVEQVSDEKMQWKAQVFWSHRTWESTILEQVPNERIVWRSKGQKGHIDGAVTFHELAPNLTRVVVVLEYHPQGFFERTGNLWRAQGRRVRLELKHFQRQLMTDALLHPDDIEGWQGEIRDGEVVENSSDEDDDSDESDESEEDDTSSSAESNGKQRRTSTQRTAKSAAARKSSGSDSARTATKTAPARKTGGSASSRSSSSRTGSGRRAAAAKSRSRS